MPSLKSLARDAQSRKKPAVPKKPAKPAQPPATFKSAEYVQESDEEEQEISQKENESDNDDESLPSDPADLMTTSNGKLQRPAGRISSTGHESEESGSEADDEEEEEEEASVVAGKRTSIVTEPAKKSTKNPSASIVSAKAPSAYKPPTGFEKEKLDGAPKAAQAFKKANLEGKEIWYFTAPASLPLSSIEQMSLKDAKAGKSILNHKGNEYGFIRDSAEDKTYTKIMVPHGPDDGYQTTKKSIDHIFHLQQIIKLPGVHDSSRIAAHSTKATVPAKKPVRQQPQGLKMRFRPIGFGDGETGKIGSSSSSIDGSSAESISDEEMEEAPAFRRPASIASDTSDADESSEGSQSGEDSSDSDIEMTEVPSLPAKPAVKDKRDKPSATITSSQGVTNSSLKRKHGEGEEKKSKHSSFRSSSIDDRELKRLKKKQTESQRSLEDRVSASIELQKSPAQPLAAKTKPTASKKETPIRPPKPAILPNSSRVSQAGQVFAGKDDQRSSEKPKAKKHEISESETPVRKNGLSLQDLTRATDPSLTGEERRKKIKKLKHKE